MTNIARRIRDWTQRGYLDGAIGQQSIHCKGQYCANGYAEGYLKGWTERDLLIEYEQQIIKSLNNN